MKKLILCLVLFGLGFSYSCQKTPTFPADNINDSKSPIYEVPVPANFRAFLLNSTDTDSVLLTWDAPEKEYTGTIIERFLPCSDEFVEVDKVLSNETEYEFLADSLFIENEFRLRNYYINTRGDSLVSGNVNYTTRQAIIDINAELTEDGFVRLKWNHNITESNTTLKLFRSNSTDGEQEIGEFELSDSTFIDEIEFNPFIKTTYTITAESPCLTSNITRAEIGRNGVPTPTNFRFIRSVNPILRFYVNHHPEIDSIKVEAKSQVSNASYSFHVEANDDGRTTIFMEELDESAAPYQLSIYGSYKGIKSDTLNRFLERSTDYTLTSSSYVQFYPANDDIFILNDGNRIAYVKKPLNEANIYSLVVININTGETEATHVLSESLLDAHYDKVSNVLYARVSHGIFVINPDTGDRSFIFLPSTIQPDSAFAFNTSENLAYLVNTNQRLVLYNNSLGETTSTLNLIDPIIKLSDDNRFLYGIANEGEYLRVYDTDDHSVIYETPEGDETPGLYPRGQDVFFDGTMMYLLKYGRRLDRISLSDGEETHIFTLTIAQGSANSSALNRVENQFITLSQFSQHTTPIIRIFNLNSRLLIS